MTACVKCKEVITNPLCPGCVSKAVHQWVAEKQISLDPFNSHLCDSGELCIQCQHDINLCTYCFTEDLFEEISEEYPELLEEFAQYFHFDLDRKGYAQHIAY